MSLSNLVNHATDKERFHTVDNYIDFCARYLEYVETGLQARIVSQNESHYQFFQYKQDGSFNITRPINSRLMYDADGFSQAASTAEGRATFVDDVLALMEKYGFRPRRG